MFDNVYEHKYILSGGVGGGGLENQTLTPFLHKNQFLSKNTTNTPCMLLRNNNDFKIKTL